MYGSLDVSTSAMIAQRTRMDVVSANLAGQHVILNEQGEYEPYRRKIALLSAGNPAGGSAEGVHVADIIEDDGELIRRLEPTSIYADKDGYVGYPNINPVTETMNAMEAARAYEANIAAIEATKSMITLSLQMIA